MKKSITTDKHLQENFSYTEGEMPVLRFRNRLDHYQNGEITHHWHPEFAFGILLHGKLDYQFFDTSMSCIHQTLEAGDGFFINSRVLHGYQQIAPGTDIFTFGMLPAFFATARFGTIYQKIIIPVVHSRKTGFFFRAGQNEDTGILELFKNFQSLCTKALDYELRAMELICRIWQDLAGRFNIPEIIASLPGFSLTRANRLRQMIEFIHQHYGESLTVDQIAQGCHTSKRECFRTFREIMDISPMEYLNQYRLSAAAYLLSNTDQSQAVICEHCGFDSISYFTKCFKNRYGVTPRQFRL